MQVRQQLDIMHFLLITLLLPSRVSDLGLLIAVLGHKGLAAFALGSVILPCTESTKGFVCWLSLFALATPCGIGIGLIISG